MSGRPLRLAVEEFGKDMRIYLPARARTFDVAAAKWPDFEAVVLAAADKIDVLELKLQMARMYLNHEDQCKARARGRCDCGLDSVLVEVNKGAK